LKKIFLVIFLLHAGGCLSQTLPAYTISVLDSSRSAGYYFFCAVQFGSTSSANYPLQLILDRYGRPVYFRKTFGAGSNFKLLANGKMSFNAQLRFFWKDSLFNMVDTVTTKNGIVLDPHDIQVLPNGNILLLGVETVTMDLSGFNLFNHNGSPGSAGAQVKCGVVQELDSTRNVVFEWHAKDYYSFDDVDEEFLFSPINVDWTHFNAVEMDTDGNILVSSRHFNEITKINRGDSSIIWRLGGKRNQFTFTNDTAKFIGQHDIRRLANGHVTLYDDGEATPLHPATAKEYALDETAFTATLAWSYTENATSYSNATGNVQRLPNGHTLTNYGNLTNANLVFNVVDTAGTKIFEISFPDSAASYNAFNYLALPWSLPRPVISCDSASGTLDAGPGYLSYLWSTGAITQTTTVPSAGTYWVQVRLADGGYIRSEYMDITNPSNPCLVLPVKDIDKTSFQIFPNPSGGKLMVTGFAAGTRELKIFNVFGQEVFRSDAAAHPEIQIDISELPPGAYILRLGNAREKFIKE